MISPSMDKFNYSYFEFFTYGMKIEFMNNCLHISSPNNVINLETIYPFEYLELVSSIFKGIIKSGTIVK